MLSNHAADAREARVLRDRLAAADDALDALDAGGDPACSAAMVAKTTQVTTYPTTASAAYAVIPTELGGTEAEGQPVTYVPRTDAVAFALNLGSKVPPQGTYVVCHACGGRWCFRYD
jgi:hypothetical protein